jgi:Cell Wall Hydrolase
VIDMAASEFLAAAIAAFSVVHLPTATPLSAPTDMRCMAMPAGLRALEAGPLVRDWRDGWSTAAGVARLRLARGCVDGAPTSSLDALVATLWSWLEGAGANLVGAPPPRAMVWVTKLPDPADADPLQKMIREAVDDLRSKDPTVELDRKQLACLQRALYFEARGEGELGLAAVAHVALNRVGTRPARATVCDVVREPGQFAPYLNGEPDEADLAQTEEDASRLAIEIAAQVMAGFLPDPSRGGRYFYAPAILKVVPAWVKGMKETARIGGHRFFAEPEIHEIRVAPEAHEIHVAPEARETRIATRN